MKEYDEKDEKSVEKIRTKKPFDHSQIITKSFISVFSDGSYIGKEINKIMITFIKKLKLMKKEETNYTDFQSIIAQLLKEMNPNIIEIVDDNNNTLAHLLVNEENIELLKLICDVYYLLLINKNDFYDWFLKENNEKMTILDMASVKGNKEMLKYFYEIISRTDGSKLNLKLKKNNIFHFSAKYNQYYSILFWYDKLQPYFPNLKLIDLCNLYDITPLHYACYHGAINCVELLLDLQANINALDKDGKSVLTYAVNSGNIKIIKKLLINGADKTIKDKKGKIPYYYAYRDNKMDIANLLKTRSCFDKIKNIFKCNCNNIEIKQLKNNKNDFELILYLFIHFIFIIIILLRSLSIDEIPIKLYYITGLCLNILFSFFSIIITTYFKCIVNFKQHIKKKKKKFINNV